MKFTFLIFAITLVVALPAVSSAWDHVYDGSVLPNDSSLGADRWASQGDLSMCSTDGNILRLDDTRTDALEGFSRGAEAGPITMEARVHTTSGSDVSYMAIGTPSFSTSTYLYPGYLQVFFDYSNLPVTYSGDLTTFHTVRVAISAQGQCYVWLDQTLVAQGVTHVGGQGTVSFGGSSESGLGQSYWDYVAYSNAFFPIPEPSSFLALGSGLLALRTLIRRRR